MADALSAALLLEEAAFDLKAGDGRKAMIAQRFLRTHFGDAGTIGPEPDAAHQVFDRIVGYAVIEL